MNDTIITIIVVCILVVADLAARIYLKKKDLNGATEDEKNKINLEIGTDFLKTVQDLTKQIIEIVQIDRTIVSDDAYEKILAKKIIDTLKNSTIVGNPDMSLVKSVLQFFPEDMIIEWIIKYVLRADEIKALIDSKKAEQLEAKKPEQVSIIDKI